MEIPETQAQPGQPVLEVAQLVPQAQPGLQGQLVLVVEPPAQLAIPVHKVTQVLQAPQVQEQPEQQDLLD